MQARRRLHSQAELGSGQLELLSPHERAASPTRQAWLSLVPKPQGSSASRLRRHRPDARRQTLLTVGQRKPAWGGQGAGRGGDRGLVVAGTISLAGRLNVGWAGSDLPRVTGAPGRHFSRWKEGEAVVPKSGEEERRSVNHAVWLNLSPFKPQPRSLCLNRVCQKPARECPPGKAHTERSSPFR